LKKTKQKYDSEGKMLLRQ